MVTYTYIDLETGEPVHASCEDEVRDALCCYILTEDDVAEQLGVSADAIAHWDPKDWWDMMLALNEDAVTKHGLARHFISEAEDYFGRIA